MKDNLMRILLLLASCLLISVGTWARGVSPYLPLSLSPEIEHQVERLLILGDKPVLTRPIPLATITDALPKACERDRVLCRQVKQYLKRFMDTAAVTHKSLDVAYTNDNEITLANQHGMSADSNFQASVGAYWQPSEYLIVNAGFVSYDGDTTPTGSFISVGVDYAQLDIGYRDHWFSPMTDSAYLISANAQTMPSVTLSNYQPITGWNIRYELFLAEMSKSDRIRVTQTEFTSGKPLLAGLHLSIEPVAGWTLGINRIMQFGGGDRGGRSFQDIVDAFFNPHGADNRGDGSQGIENEFGNQAASFTSRFMYPGEVPFSVYFEYAGEDTSYASNTRLGNVGVSLGINFPKIHSDYDLTVEMSEWQNGWYEHFIYVDGLKNEGVVIGHWGANQREVPDEVGAQSLMVKVGWQPDIGGLAVARYRTLKNEDYTPPEYERGQEFSLSYSLPWREYIVGAELLLGNDALGQDYHLLSAHIRF